MGVSDFFRSEHQKYILLLRICLHNLLGRKGHDLLEPKGQNIWTVVREKKR